MDHCAGHREHQPDCYLCRRARRLISEAASDKSITIPSMTFAAESIEEDRSGKSEWKNDAGGDY